MEPAPKEKAQSGIDRMGLNGDTNEPPNVASAPTEPDNAAACRAEQKRFANAQARLALHGYVLRKLSDGGFICTKWNLCRELTSLDDVERFASLVGAIP